jgi:hypothetical protein
VPTVSALNPCPRSIQVGEFEVAIGGGIWVAIRVSSCVPLTPTLSPVRRGRKIEGSVGSVTVELRDDAEHSA